MHCLPVYSSQASTLLGASCTFGTNLNLVLQIKRGKIVPWHLALNTRLLHLLVVDAELHQPCNTTMDMIIKESEEAFDMTDDEHILYNRMYAW